MATAENLAFEARRAELERRLLKPGLKPKSARLLCELSTLEITARVGSEDKLFGSIGVADVVDVVTAAGVEIEEEVRMPEGPIRTTGGVALIFNCTPMSMSALR